MDFITDEMRQAERERRQMMAPDPMAVAIEELERQLAECREERDSWRDAARRYNGAELTRENEMLHETMERQDVLLANYREQCDMLREALLDCQEECDMLSQAQIDYRAENDFLRREWDECREELAAAEARERRYREALSGMISATKPPVEQCDCADCEAKRDAYDALALVPDDQALIEMIERELVDMGPQIKDLREANKMLQQDLLAAQLAIVKARSALETNYTTGKQSALAVLKLDDRAALDAALGQRTVEVLDAVEARINNYVRDLEVPDLYGWGEDTGEACQNVLDAHRAALEKHGLGLLQAIAAHIEGVATWEDFASATELEAEALQIVAGDINAALEQARCEGEKRLAVAIAEVVRKYLEGES